MYNNSINTTVIIPNYNGLKYMEPCMEALRRQTYTGFCVLIVDNGSSDGSVSYLENLLAVSRRSNPAARAFIRGAASEPGACAFAAQSPGEGKEPDSESSRTGKECVPDSASDHVSGDAFAGSYAFPIDVIFLPVNTGFSCAVNAGISASDTDYVVLLNNDTEAAPGYLEMLIRPFLEPGGERIAAVSPMMVQLYNRDLLDDAGDGYNLLGWAFQRGVGQRTDKKKFGRRTEVFSACAGAAAYRRKALMEITPVSWGYDLQPCLLKGTGGVSDAAAGSYDAIDADNSHLSSCGRPEGAEVKADLGKPGLFASVSAVCREDAAGSEADLDKGSPGISDSVSAGCQADSADPGDAADPAEAADASARAYFDPRHFAYLEDLDVSFRLRIHGYRIIYTPDSVVYHVGSGTSGSKYNSFKVRLAARNNVYLNYKNMPPLMLLINLPGILLGVLVKLAFFAAGGFAKDYAAGFAEGVRTLGTVRERRVHFRMSRLPVYIRLELMLITDTLSYIQDFIVRQVSKLSRRS